MEKEDLIEQEGFGDPKEDLLADMRLLPVGQAKENSHNRLMLHEIMVER